MIRKKILSTLFLLAGGAISIYVFIKSDGNFSNVYWSFIFQAIILSFIAVYEIYQIPNFIVDKMEKRSSDFAKLNNPGYTLSSTAMAWKFVLGITAIGGAAILLIPMVLTFNYLKQDLNLPGVNVWVVFSVTTLFLFGQLGILIMKRQTQKPNEPKYEHDGEIQDGLLKIAFRPFKHVGAFVVGICIGTYIYSATESISLFAGVIAVATFAEIFPIWFSMKSIY